MTIVRVSKLPPPDVGATNYGETCNNPFIYADRPATMWLAFLASSFLEYRVMSPSAVMAGRRRFFEDGVTRRISTRWPMRPAKRASKSGPVASCRTHVHLIVVPRDEDGLRRTFRYVHRHYTGNIDARLRETGHLWQGRFSSVAMDESHLVAALRYLDVYEGWLRAHSLADRNQLLNATFGLARVSSCLRSLELHDTANAR